MSSRFILILLPCPPIRYSLLKRRRLLSPLINGQDQTQHYQPQAHGLWVTKDHLPLSPTPFRRPAVLLTWNKQATELIPVTVPSCLQILYIYRRMVFTLQLRVLLTFLERHLSILGVVDLGPQVVDLEPELVVYPPVDLESLSLHPGLGS